MYFLKLSVQTELSLHIYENFPGKSSVTEQDFFIKKPKLLFIMFMLKCDLLPIKFRSSCKKNQ